MGCYSRCWSEVVVLDIGAYFAQWDHVKLSKKEGGKVFVEVAANGQVTFHEGRLTTKEHKARQKRNAGEEKLSGPELTAPLSNYLGLHRHAAVRQALLRHHALALRLAVA